jgi:hypothetical protein
MRKGFLIYEEMPKYLTIYEEAVGQNMALHPIPSEFIYIYEVYEENLIFFFIIVGAYCERGLSFTCSTKV